MERTISEVIMVVIRGENKQELVEYFDLNFSNLQTMEVAWKGKDPHLIPKCQLKNLQMAPLKSKSYPYMELVIKNLLTLNQVFISITLNPQKIEKRKEGEVEKEVTPSRIS